MKRQFSAEKKLPKAVFLSLVSSVVNHHCSVQLVHGHF